MVPPPCPLGDQVGSLSDELLRNDIDINYTPLYLGPRTHIANWEALGADNVLLTAIRRGVRAPLLKIPDPLAPRCVQPQSLQNTIQKYAEEQGIRKMTTEETQRTKFWVPIFGRPKKEGGTRLITDLRNLNQCMDIPHHRPESWKTVLRTLEDKSLKWGITLDMSSYFHHLSIDKKTQRWMRFQIEGVAYQIQAMPFGWSGSPWWSHKMAQPIRAWLNQNLITHCWYVDDVLILGETKEQCESNASKLVNLLTSLGIKVNKDKSMIAASQEVNYIGHCFNLLTNLVSHIPSKLQHLQRMVKHQMKSNVMTPRYLCALAGSLLDAVKSNVALTGLAQNLMQQAALLAQKNATDLSLPYRSTRCWTKSGPKSAAAVGEWRRSSLNQ